jgi:hypothetical protein
MGQEIDIYFYHEIEIEIEARWGTTWILNR